MSAADLVREEVILRVESVFDGEIFLAETVDVHERGFGRTRTGRGMTREAAIAAALGRSRLFWHDPEDEVGLIAAELRGNTIRLGITGEIIHAL